MLVNFTEKSRNAKTGPIPVSTTSNETCPAACPLKSAGCYAEAGPLGMLWRKLSAGGSAFGLSWSEFAISKVAALPAGTMWRHNQAGDLPGASDTLDTKALGELVAANDGRRGFTYTHKPLAKARERKAIAAANAKGFTVNLSGNNPTHADKLADMGIGPVVTVLPGTVQGNVNLSTPAGRRIVVCPATYREDVSCASCGLCSRANRKTVVGFPVHGTSHKRAAAATQNLH
jgi:hypothetical protein